MLKLFLFGTPRCQRDRHPIHLPRRKCLALLAYLALNSQPHNREALAALLYPDSASAGTYLRRTLSEIRHSLGDNLLLADNEVQLVENHLWVDVLEFENLVKSVQLPNTQLPITNLETAVSLYTADFMMGFTLPDTPEFDEWQFFQGEGLRHSLALTLQQLIDWNISQKTFAQGIEYGRHWLALDPLHEPAHRCLMRLYAWDNQQVAAQRQYEICHQLLNEELGTVPEEETTALYEGVKTRQILPANTSHQHPLSSHLFSPIKADLPTPSTSLIGREKELTDLKAKLTRPDTRLLTVTGPGGIGKTRLALEVGQQLLPVFAHGAAFVPLASVAKADDVAPAIAAALKLQFSGQKSLREQLLQNLQQQQILLILDNFEQLLDSVDLLKEILHSAPQVKLLVTSRERLNVKPEWVYDLAGLTFPQQANASATIKVLLGVYGAPALFVQRAQQVRAAFRPSAQNWPAILSICQLVEGMPLGLELAASWIPTMSCQEIAAGINQNLDFLTTTLRDIPDRHRSVRAVFQHSWSLLSADEQTVLRQLSVFRGGFTREVAEEVTGIKLVPLAGLVRKSLVVREDNGRYTIHELLRQFAAEKLAESPADEAATQAAHATAYAAFLQAREDDLWNGRQIEALNEIAADLDNVRQAWQWANEQMEVTLLNQAAIALFFFFDMRGFIQEGERVFRLSAQKLQTLAYTPDQQLCLGKLLTGQGWFSVWVVSFVTGETNLQEAATWLRSVEPLPLVELSLTLNYLGLIRCFRGKAVWGEGTLQESLALAREAKFPALIGRSLFNLGQTAVLQGEFARAEPYLEEASSQLAAIGELHRRSLVLNRLGETLECLGDFARAEKCHQESLIIRQQMDDHIRLPGALNALGLLAYRLGDYDRAERMARDGLAQNQQAGNQYQIGEDNKTLGLIVLARGDLAQAETRFQQSLAIFREMGIRNRQPEVLNGLARVAIARGEYEQAQPLLTESLAVTQDNGNMAQQASTLHLWGILKLREGNSHEAAQCYAKALKITGRIKAAPLTLAICLSVTRLYLPPYGNKLQLATDLLHLVLAHPATEAIDREQARNLIVEFDPPAAQEIEDLWTAVIQVNADLMKI